MASKDLVVNEFDDVTLRTIYKYAPYKTIREIANLTGLKPEQVLAAKRQIIDSIDILTINEWRAKLLMDLQALSDEAMSAFETVAEEKAKAPLLVAATGAMKAVLAEFRNMAKEDTREVDALNAKRLKEILRLFDSVVIRLIDHVSENSDLDKDELIDLTAGWMHEEAEAMDLD